LAVSIQVTAVTYYFYTTHNKKLLHNPNTSIYMSFRTPQDHNATGQGYNFIDALFNPTGGSGGNDAVP
jgi:hypothetical protein